MLSQSFINVCAFCRTFFPALESFYRWGAEFEARRPVEVDVCLIYIKTFPRVQCGQKRKEFNENCRKNIETWDKWDAALSFFHLRHFHSFFLSSFTSEFDVENIALCDSTHSIHSLLRGIFPLNFSYALHDFLNFLFFSVFSTLRIRSVLIVSYSQTFYLSSWSEIYNRILSIFLLLSSVRGEVTENTRNITEHSTKNESSWVIIDSNSRISYDIRTWWELSNLEFDSPLVLLSTP